MSKETSEIIDLEKPNRQLFHEFLLDTSLDGFESQVSYMVSFGGVPKLKAQKRVKKDFMRWLTAVRVCIEEGHRWECTASIDPDSGSESLTCKRCGESHSIRYY